MPRIPGATVRAINQLDRPEGIDAMNGARTLAIDYDVYEIAHLAGGPRRAVEAAVVALAGGGHLTVDRSTGHLSAAGVPRRHWLEAAVSDGVGQRDWRSVRTLRRRLVLDERLAAVGRRLESDGLLRRSASGSRRHRTWQLVALTGEGRRTLRSLRAQPPVDHLAEGTDAMAVALGGPEALGDTSLRRALFHPPAPGPVPGDRRSRREIRDARLGLSASAAGATFWIAGSEHGTGSGFYGDGFGGGFGGDGGGGGGGDGGGG
ncbi:TIGR04222 domain-containing protein [Blastococcus aurantiacus]|uniref:TIGR04222 domain-containing protein n=1 Tax=Blastococcus aurantiacus TaxID=1550231 RepID=A0A1G7QZI7_9ACTN|nr:TIGR04222 domain-containing membrane protein [Blastococcus aurantiacus]SDG03942.1 TIGR04222 domain-containing protein [Blastococcus aurantiacus]